MRKRWKLVARLGVAGRRHPHLLADPNGWCLRLGPRPGDDDKFYASLQTALRGLVEHFTRRRLLGSRVALDVKGLVRHVEDALHSALTLCGRARQKEAIESGIRPSHGQKTPGGTSGTPRRLPKPFPAFHAESGRRIRPAAG